MKSLLLAGAALFMVQMPSFSASPSPTADEAQKFIQSAELALSKDADTVNRANWVNATFITDDTDWLAAKANAESTELGVKLAKGAARFDGVALTDDLRRKLKILKTGLTLAAPETPGAAQELADISTKLSSIYGKGKGTLEGQPLSGNDLEDKMRTVRDPAQLAEMWTSWHNNVGRPMRDDYARLVTIANQGARDLGFKDTGAMWRSGYDMDPDQFAAEVDRLWNQVKPLYDQVHCYVRGRLNTKYGDAVQPKTGPIRADLLGNMWAQEWGGLKDLALPEGSSRGYDLTALLKDKNFTPIKMVQTGEGFFTSLGFAPLPKSFWEHSQFTKPADREVICHASAWDVDNIEDLRIKMCIKINDTDFITIHHELGHNFYQRAYNKQDLLYKNGANDGFHEAIGDMIALSVTPDYLVKIGLLDKAPATNNDIGQLMALALDKIAFLPFGLLVDKWRWQVFSGQITPANYNAKWWELRQQYQGIVPPTPRSETDFDAGAKYHVAASVPYMRYFLARILQFQFHQAACKAAGWKGPLSQCSIYGNKAVGEKFNAMLALGASKPWPEALQTFTGSRRMDGSAITAYFQPLITYLKTQNKSQTCGW